MRSALEAELAGDGYLYMLADPSLGDEHLWAGDNVLRLKALRVRPANHEPVLSDAERFCCFQSKA